MPAGAGVLPATGSTCGRHRKRTVHTLICIHERASPVRCDPDRGTDRTGDPGDPPCHRDSESPHSRGPAGGRCRSGFRPAGPFRSYSPEPGGRSDAAGGFVPGTPGRLQQHVSPSLELSEFPQVVAEGGDFMWLPTGEARDCSSGSLGLAGISLQLSDGRRSEEVRVGPGGVVSTR